MMMYDKRRACGTAATVSMAPSLWEVDAVAAARMLGCLLTAASVFLLVKTMVVLWWGAPMPVLALYGGFGLATLAASALHSVERYRDASTVLVLGFWTMAMLSAVFHASVLGPGTLVLMPTILAAALFRSWRFAAGLAAVAALLLLGLASDGVLRLLPPPLISVDAMRFWAVACTSLAVTVVLCLLAQRTMAEKQARMDEPEAPVLSADQRDSRLAVVGAATVGIAHDLNNILTVILSTGPLLRRKMGDDDHGLLEMMEGAADSASRLTREMVRFAGGAEASGESLEIGGVLSDMESILRAAMPPQVDLRVNAAAPEAYVHAERVWIEQVLLNLTLNARDAIGSEGTVVIETALADADGEQVPRRRDSFIRLRVADDGPGMDPQTAERVFERAFSTKDGGGRGLGLATVRNIVDRLGGQVRLDTAEGRGARFDVYLPVSEPADPPIARGAE